MENIINTLRDKWYDDCLVHNIPVSPGEVKDIVEELVEMIQTNEEDKEMTYQEQLKAILGFLYNETKCYATSSTYCVPYEKVKNGYGMWIGTRNVQDDLWEMWQNSQYVDRISMLDFDDDKEWVVVMMWKTNKKKMQKYTLDNYEEFVKNALLPPPIEEFEDGTIDEDKWYKEHNIHIITGNHDIELWYGADNVNEIEYALREMYEAEHDGPPTTSNTIGSEYRDATWKDILRLNIMRRIYDGTSMKEAIHDTVYNFDTNSYRKCMNEINNQTSYNDEFEVNFFKISSDGMEKLFEASERRSAIKNMLCKNIQLSEMIAENGAHDDKTVITDYSIHPSGHFVGWHYGVDWDVDSEVNQQYINDYIKEMIG